MPNNWKTYKLGEIVDVKQGLAINKKTDHLLTDKSSMPLFKIRDLINNTVEHYVKEDEVPKQCIANYEDLIYSRTGQVGLVFRGKIGCIHNNCFKIIPNESIINKDLLFWFLKQPEIIEYANNIASGSVQKDLNHTAFKSIEISISDNINEQKNIAEIFNIINDKIENNLAINKTLEEMAMALYKHWFVDFGPFQDGEFVESELGRIPKGWKIVQFRELLSLLKDGSHNPPKRVDSGVKFIAGATDIKKLEVTFNKCSYITQDDYNKMHKTWEIKEKDILMTIVGTIGNTAIVQNKDLPFSLQRSIAIFRPIEEIPNYFIYLLINNESFKEYVKAHTNPTGQPGIYLKILGSYVLAQPNFQILKQFNDVIEPLFDQMFSNLTENQTLTQLRDNLLPKLISGEVRLKEFQES